MLHLERAFWRCRPPASLPGGSPTETCRGFDVGHGGPARSRQTADCRSHRSASTSEPVAGLDRIDRTVDSLDGCRATRHRILGGLPVPADCDKSETEGSKSAPGLCCIKTPFRCMMTSPEFFTKHWSLQHPRRAIVPARHRRSSARRQMRYFTTSAPILQTAAVLIARALPLQPTAPIQLAALDQGKAAGTLRPGWESSVADIARGRSSKAL